MFICPLIQRPFQNLSPAIKTLLKAYALINQAIIFPSTAPTCPHFTDQITEEDWRFMKANDMKKQKRVTAGDRNDQSTIQTQNEIQTWLYYLFLQT